MKYFKIYIIPGMLIFLTVFLLVLQRNTPEGKLWSDWSVFYAACDADDQFIYDSLKKFGCENVVCGKNQKIPIELGSDTPEISLLAAGVEKSTYLTDRNGYFYDKDGNFKVFYIPEKYSDNLKDACDYIRNVGSIYCGVDLSSSYPVIPVILLVIFTAVLIWKTEKKLLFTSAAVLPVFFCFMRPFYSEIACIFILLLGISVSLKMWNRKGGLKRLLRIRILQVMLLVSVVISFLTDLQDGFMFILLVLAEGSVFHFYSLFEKKSLERYSFRPVQIRSARVISLISKKTVFSIAACGAAIGLLIICSVFAINMGESSSGGSLMLPSSSVQGSLPDLTDYSKWRWETLTFPYVSLNQGKNLSEPLKGDKVQFSTYNDNPDSMEEVVSVMCYDDEFINNGLKVIDSLPYPSVESLIKSQGENFSAGYSSSGSQNVTIFTIILLVVLLSLPVVFYLLCYKKARR